MLTFRYAMKNTLRDKYLLLETRNFLIHFHLLSLYVIKAFILSFHSSSPSFPFKTKTKKRNWQFFMTSDKIWQAYTEETAVREVGCGITSLS